MVRVAGVVADPGDTDNQVPPDALAVKVRVPELAATFVVAVAFVVEPAFADRPSLGPRLGGVAISDAAFAEAAAMKRNTNGDVGRRTRLKRLIFIDNPRPVR
jgi:hypothetical protein